jgi:hypothetical protein
MKTERREALEWRARKCGAFVHEMPIGRYGGYVVVSDGGRTARACCNLDEVEEALRTLGPVVVQPFE